MSRIDVLEKQLILSTKNMNEETFKKSINALRDEKVDIEYSAKVRKLYFLGLKPRIRLLSLGNGSITC